MRRGRDLGHRWAERGAGTLRLRTRRRAPADGAVEGPARVDRRTKNLLQRLRAGDVAVIDHEDIDVVAAEALLQRRPAAIVNARRSLSGRYPTEGPLILARAGLPVVDAVETGILERVREGDVLRIEGNRVFCGEDLVATGERLDAETLERALGEAERAVGDALEHFVRNTMDYLARERDLIIKGVGIPDIETSLDGRHALVVVRGHQFRQDLTALRGYIAEMRPIIIAVDGAADALLDDGLRPDLIIGDMDSVSTESLTCGAELIVHAYPDGRAPGMERVEALGLAAKVFRSAGTSEDIALLLAYERGAEPIVAVGTHMNLVEFLDKGREGMSSTFLVRLKVGTKLVDAKGVNRLYRPQIGTRALLLLVGAAFVAMLMVAWMSPPLRLWMHVVREWLLDVWFDLSRLFS